MTLAQVVYHMSTDTDFANQLFSNPELTLKRRGWKLSSEELAFLRTTREQDGIQKTRIEDLAVEVRKW